MNDSPRRDELDDLLAEARGFDSEENRTKGRTAAIRAFNRIEAESRRERRLSKGRIRARPALLGLSWLAAAGWTTISIVGLATGSTPRLYPENLSEQVGTLAALLALTPLQLVAGLALLAAATTAGLRLALTES
jgi:pimeloyl-ACP methyl ester carboxylesterase